MDAELEKLILNLAGLEGMLWVVGGGELVSENTPKGIREPTFEDGYATVTADSWHFHLRMDSVAGAQFVEAEDHGIPYLYYVRLSDAQQETLLRVYFPNPYLDENDKPTEFQPQKLKLFEELRDRFVGTGGIVFVKRPRQPSS